jgi:hypothetical protein
VVRAILLQQQAATMEQIASQPPEMQQPGQEQQPEDTGEESLADALQRLG